MTSESSQIFLCVPSSPSFLSFRFAVYSLDGTKFPRGSFGSRAMMTTGLLVFPRRHSAQYPLSFRRRAVGIASRRVFAVCIPLVARADRSGQSRRLTIMGSTRPTVGVSGLRFRSQGVASLPETVASRPGWRSVALTSSVVEEEGGGGRVPGEREKKSEKNSNSRSQRRRTRTGIQ